MRKIKDILRLQSLRLSQRQIARSLGISKGAVHKYLSYAKKGGIEWSSESEETCEKAVETLLSQKPVSSSSSYSMPDCEWVHQELKRTGVTLTLLHTEYKSQYPHQHYHYSQFCYHYRRWKRKQEVCLRQTYKGGDKLFIDYAGPTVPILCPQTGETRQSAIFIACLGASQYTYVEATWDQTLPNWIGSHVRALEFFGGVPALLIPDNLKSGVSQACRYDPDLNPAYAEMVSHYNTAVLPARPYKPRDKSKVENAVLLVERWILARLRHQTFYSLEELNQCLKDLLKELNHQPFQKMPGSRQSLFKEIDQPALSPLPVHPYEQASFKRLKVGKDYHVEVKQHFYSVPFAYCQEEVDVRITAHVLEIFYEGKRIASHELKQGPGTTSHIFHMPEAHRHHHTWTRQACLEWAHHIGPSTQALLLTLFDKKSHDDQRYRLFLGFTRLAKAFGEKRLEKACHRALVYDLYSYKKISVFLEKGLDHHPLPLGKTQETSPISHTNIRGSHYYH